MSMRDFYKKYKDIILYAFFGVCTTLVNVVSFGIISYTVNMTATLGAVIAWGFAVSFAYCTNRKWVFHSEAEGFCNIAREISSFFLCRLATGIVDWLCMWIFVDIYGLHDMLIKLLANILVIILNYIASKLMVFKGGNNVG